MGNLGTTWVMFVQQCSKRWPRLSKTFSTLGVSTGGRGAKAIPLSTINWWPSETNYESVWHWQGVTKPGRCECSPGDPMARIHLDGANDLTSLLKYASARHHDNNMGILQINYAITIRVLCCKRVKHTLKPTVAFYHFVMIAKRMLYLLLENI